MNAITCSLTHPGEPLIQYIIRHTLKRPRDMIAIGNEILRARADMVESNPRSVVRHAVNVVASSVIAESYMGEIASRWPWDGANPIEGIKCLLASFKKNVLTRREAEQLQAIFAKSHRQIVQTCHPLCALASFGLIGWPVQDKNNGGYVQYFLRPGEREHIHIPAAAQWLLVHPILYGEPYHIAAVQGQVIGAGLSFNPTNVDKLSVQAEA